MTLPKRDAITVQMQTPRPRLPGEISMIDEPKNEEAVCRAVIKVVEQRTGEALRIVARPDQTDRSQPAVEMLLQSPAGRRYALEHTRVESFPQQISDGKAFADLLEPLEAKLSGTLPGPFWLIIPVGALDAVRRNAFNEIRQDIEKWVASAAGSLDGEEESEGDGTFTTTVVLPSVGFPVTLRRTKLTGSKLVIMREAPADLDNLRAQRIAQALAKKLPKLAGQKAAGLETILALESNDIALGNRAVVGQAVREALATRNDAPDLIYLIETEISPYAVWPLKDGVMIYPDGPLKGVPPIYI